MTTTEKITEKVDKALHSEDRPIGDVEPAAPFVMVGLSYMLILALLIAAMAILWAMFA